MGPGGTSLKRLLIWPNTDKDQVRGLTGRISKWATDHGIDTIIPTTLAERVGYPDLGQDLEHVPEGSVDGIIVLGGDGTLLHAAKALAHLNCPILGVNLGHLGFLTEVEVPDLLPALTAMVNNQYDIDQRHLLTARVMRGHRELAHFEAMNDVVVTKGPFARLINLETFVDDAYVTTYPADGLIVASPTGSTAYSLSAGGPILSPALSVMVVTPICPHSFFDRSIVINGDQQVKIRVRAMHRDTLVTVDGQETYPLVDGDEVLVETSPTTIRLFRRPGWSFFQVLRGWRKGH